ncbi:hypothetical protein SFRURICE_005251 [Spodoptera frugiperda]|nr:hypothetical protein SFRURICE_005251 [Spodoptera frugiperda]
MSRAGPASSLGSKSMTSVVGPVSLLLDKRDSVEEKKKRFQFKYNPNKGYEPYWVGGEHILTSTTPGRGTTTTTPPPICNYDCNYIYQKITAVCAVYIDALPKVVCGACTGKPGGYLEYDITKAYYTMKYCDFLAVQCKQDILGKARIMYVHFGACKTDKEINKPLWEPSQVVSRMQWYLNSFDKQEDPLITKAMTTPKRKKQKSSDKKS